MLHLLFAVFSLVAGGSGNGVATAQAVVPSSNLVAEDQTPTGKFTTATEVKPILAMTLANWIGVWEWNGNDLNLCFTSVGLALWPYSD